jgi:electron transfer flavoprotein alpha subunit
MIPLARQSALRSLRTQIHNTSVASRNPTQAATLARLLSTLAILEQRDGKLNGASLGAVTAGQKLGGSVHGLVAGKGAKAVAEEAAKTDGIEKILAVDNAAYDRGLAENWAPLLVENIKKGGYTHVIVGHSAFGKNLLPRVAAMLDVQQISDIMAIEGEDSMTTLLPRRCNHANIVFSIRPTNLRRQRHPHSPIHRPHQTPHRPTNILPTSRIRLQFSLSRRWR